LGGLKGFPKPLHFFTILFLDLHVYSGKREDHSHLQQLLIALMTITVTRVTVKVKAKEAIKKGEALTVTIETA
jgi:hypothetical protein